MIDSGLGGISVARALRAALPGLALIYVADLAGFPYGNRSAGDITARSIHIIGHLQRMHGVREVVVACNTLSTLSLAALRAAFPAIAFTGTVPAIKVAAQESQSRRFTLLATPNTAHSPYSKSLIDQFAQGCVVDGYGAPNLASMAEGSLLGGQYSDAQWRAEIAPCFHDDARGKTDRVILGCTHYPLVLNQLQRHAPWPVAWVDSSDAIARQALRYHTPTFGDSAAYLTDDAEQVRYAALFAREGFATTGIMDGALAPGAARA